MSLSLCRLCMLSCNSCYSPPLLCLNLSISLVFLVWGFPSEHVRKNFLNKINQESKCACSIHLLCDHEQIKFSEPHFPNWFRNFSVIWQEGNALKYSISDRLLLMIAMEICIGVTYRTIPINLLFYNSTPSIISKLFSHTTNFRKRGEIILWSFPRLYSSWVTSLSDPTQSVYRKCII